MRRPFEGLHPALAPDVFIAEGAHVIGNVTAETGVSIWYNSVVRGDVCPIFIGEETNVQDLSMIHVTSNTHPTKIGKRVTIGHRAIIHGATIEDESLIGMGAIVLDGATVGRWSLIGAGALVTPGTTIPERSVVLGSPGKVVRRVSDEEISSFLESAETVPRTRRATPNVVKLAFFFFVLLFSETVFAQTPDEIVADSKLGSAVCLVFVDQTAVDYRTERWLAAIRKMPRDYVLGWITGTEDPPKLASREATKQRNCLIQRVAIEAAEGALIVDGAGVSTTPAGMKQLAKRAKKNPLPVARNLIRSHYRSASVQSSIWRRKFLFSGRNFNVVSRASAKRCGLQSGESWKPSSKKHQKCWYAMKPEQREQEILLASSAPGTSRHHWGTDFDIFGLNPRTFYPGRRLYDEYEWMVKSAIQLGMVQPYTSTSQVDGLGYMEERWHWSYAPIANALLEYARENESELDKKLNEQWDRFAKRWGKKRGPYFGYVRQNWRAFVFNVAKKGND